MKETYELATSLGSGELAPDFELRGPNGETVRLSDYRGTTVVLYFYPKAFTGGCTTQACGLRDAYSTFQEQGIAILGISVDDVETQRRFRDEYSLPFPVLADPDTTTSQAYGVFGIQRDDGSILSEARRVTFIIGADGVIKRVIDPAHADVHADEVLSALDA